jgi:hypothetical protein
MSKYLVLALAVVSSPAFADWYCEAYCPTGNGAIVMFQHGNHPVDALNSVVQACMDGYGGPLSYADRGGLFFVASDKNVRATVANACKQIDTTCK